MIRKHLQAATRDLHDLLDAHVGDFRNEAAYRAYLVGTYRFRATLDPALRRLRGQSWRIVPLGIHLQADLADLEMACPAHARFPSLSTPSAVAGALYVIEGSGLGARVLARRAALLGFDGGFAARHLARQSDDAERWRRFLLWLEAAELDAEASEAAAREVFALAVTSYGARAVATADASYA